MRVAIVHDFACQRGGAERVVLHLCRALAAADPFIVTSLYVPEATYPEFADYEVRATRIGSPGEADRFRRHVLRYPAEFRAQDLSDADLVVVSSSAFAHHVRHKRSVVYWHTPPRFLYDSAAYASSRLGAAALRAAAAPLRRGDRAAAVSHLGHAANSRRTAARLRQCYGIEAPVVYPPFDPSRLPPSERTDPPERRALVVSRLLRYKNVDLAIGACAELGLPLTVVGSGPEEARLHQLAVGRDVEFLTEISDRELSELYASHAVVLSPAVDDFGYVPLEAAHAGRPVVASNAEGTNENVLDGVTGRLVGTPSTAAWATAIGQVLETTYDPGALRAHANDFGGAAFDAALARWLGQVVDAEELFGTGRLSGMAR